MNAPHLTLTLFLSACLLTRAAEPAPAASTLDALPQEIAQFYMDANFVSCFSTAAERRLVDLAVRNGTDQTSSGRLGMVMQSVRRLRESFHELDPKFIHWAGASTHEDGQVIQAVSVEPKSDEVRVTVHLWTLGRKQNRMLVSQYNDQFEAMKTLATLQQQKSRTEVHVWRKQGQRWLRDPATIVPLKLEK